MKNTFDNAKFEKLQGKVFTDVGGAVGVLMAYIGDKAGVFKILENVGPCHHGYLAEKSGIDARYLLEWLSANAAAGYIDYDAQSEEFSLSPEQAAIFSHEDEPTCLQGFFELIVSQYAAYETTLDVFKTGRGRSWAEHLPGCFCGTDRFFRPGYVANLIDNWLPAFDGVIPKLEAGAKVADIGCGLGSATILLAERFPNSTIYGFDFHEPSIIEARKKAETSGLSNVKFVTTTAKEYPGKEYDFVCVFDALHDMGDPVGAAAHIKESLKPDGSFMVVEPAAGDCLNDNLNLVSSIYYSFSTMMCLPASRSQEVDLGLGNQAGEKRMTEVLSQGGFSNIRRATETPMNMILEARP